MKNEISIAINKSLVQPNIIQYTRNSKNQLNGCLVAAKIDGKVRLGYSKCCKKDIFSKKKAKLLATIRMNKLDRDYSQTLPPSMKEDIERFTERCGRYFKN